MGLREWDNLRPNLFNLFINDLPKMFDNSCQPITLNTSKLNCLMYTDGVILFPETADELKWC